MYYLLDDDLTTDRRARFSRRTLKMSCMGCLVCASSGIAGLELGAKRFYSVCVCSVICFLRSVLSAVF